MRHRLLPLFAAVALLVGLADAGPVAAAAPADIETATASDDIVAGEILVAVAPGEKAADVVDDLLGRPGRRVPGRADLRLVRTKPGREAVVADRLESSPDVRWSAPNAVFRASAVPNDPGFRFQWGLQTRATVPGAANWSPVWGGSVTGAGVTVAVLDSGVSAGPDLDGVLPGYDFVDGDPDPADENGHGTHVAGTVAQSTGNAAGVAGVASGASILPVRVLDENGDGSAFGIISGMTWAVSHGADVINVSLGGAIDGGICEAVKRATAAGVVVVAAVGNEGGPVGYPASCPGAIGVAATTFTGAIAAYSNRGAAVALAAPGGDLNADVNRDGDPDGILQYSTIGGTPGYYYLAGTSMAAPHVAGAAALLLQANPGLTLDQVRGALTGTAADLGPAGPDTSFGAGLLDVAAALRAVQTNAIPPPAGLTPPAPTGPAPDRLSGTSRYGTAAAVSREGWPGGAAEAFLAGGTTFPDALATGALAGRRTGPLLLAGPCTLPPETAEELARLRPARLTVVGGAGAVCDAVVQQAVVLTGGRAERLAGPDRYATAAALSRAGWPSNAGVVYLASGTSFADGLSGSALAPRGDGPLLLSEPCSLPEATTTELRRLRPTRVVVLGGAASVCDGVMSAAAASGATVSRVAGSDRYATAVAAAAEGWSQPPAVVYVASGSTFPDGLAVGPLAAQADAPLLLVPPCDLPAVVAGALERLNPARVVVVGGTAAVCDEAARRLAVFAAGT